MGHFIEILMELCRTYRNANINKNKSLSFPEKEKFHWRNPKLHYRHVGLRQVPAGTDEVLTSRDIEGGVVLSYVGYAEKDLLLKV